MTKKELRAYIRREKAVQPPDRLAVWSNRAAAMLHQRIRHAHCRNILLYYSLPDEVDTRAFVRTLTDEGRTVLLPVVRGEELSLHPYAGAQHMTVVPPYGIEEPTTPPFTSINLIDIAIIPGMAFTPQGQRLGRGRGFYDRLLPRLSCPLIGLAWPFQMFPSIPTEPHDISMHGIIVAES